MLMGLVVSHVTLRVPVRLGLMNQAIRYLASHVRHSHGTACRVNGCTADSGTVHWKLGFLKLAERAAGHRAEKRAAIQELRRVSDVC